MKAAVEVKSMPNGNGSTNGPKVAGPECRYAGQRPKREAEAPAHGEAVKFARWAMTTR